MTDIEKWKTLILGSGSPRRRQMLEYLQIPHTVRAADLDERSLKATNPREFALKAAFAKGCAFDNDMPKGTLVIAADTIVTLDSKIYFKPTDAADAGNMLRELSGKTHQVITGIAVREIGSATQLDAVSTNVTMKSLTDEEIAGYIESGEPMDKAGSYGIQGRGRELIQSIDGDYYNVVGLPVDKLLEMLTMHGDVSEFQLRAKTLSPAIFQ